MTTVHVIRLSGILACAFAVGLVTNTADAAGKLKSTAQSKADSSVSARASRPADPAVLPTSAGIDEEIFDRDLPLAPAPIVGSAVPHCTDVLPWGNRDATPSGDPSLIRPQPLPDPNSVLSDPDSVLSQPAPSQMPAPVASLPAGQGASTAMSFVPAFMGDFFGGAPTTISNNGLYDGSGTGFLTNAGSVTIPSTSGVGIMKLAESTSPLPRDRVFLSYNYFSNVQLAPGGIAVNRMTPGVEKTLFGGNASVEVRVPMALTLGSTTQLGQNGLPGYDTNQYELGNLTTFFKTLLYRDEQFALSTGLGVAMPTGDDVRIQDNSGNTLAQVRNQAWHVMPFAGAVYTPNDQWFAQSMLQLDFATNGNSVSSLSNSGTLQKDGSLNDPTYLFASVGTGYWLYQSADPAAHLSRVSLISELHLNSTLQHTDVVTGSAVNIGNFQGQGQTYSAVIGSNIMFDQNKSLLLGYVAPLGGGADQAFSGEFRVLFNWYFGGTQNRATRVQF